MDGSFSGILEMNIWGNKLVIDILLKECLLEDIKSFIFQYLELGLVSRSCECIKEFLDPFVDVCA